MNASSIRLKILCFCEVSHYFRGKKNVHTQITLSGWEECVLCLAMAATWGRVKAWMRQQWRGEYGNAIHVDRSG